MESKRTWNDSLGRIMQEQLDTGRGVLVLMPEASVPYVLSPGQELKTVLRVNQSTLKTNMSLTGVTNMTNLFEAMEKWLSTNRKENLVFQEDEDQPRDEPRINEETMYTGEEEPQNNWSEQEVPEHARAEILEKVTPETRRTVRKMHRGLGHPERGTMLRLMKLSGI